jgi:O-antigen ligase
MAQPLAKEPMRAAETRIAMIVTSIGIAVLGVMCAYAVARGSPLRDAAIAIALLSPIAAYLALTRPLLFPYGLYVALMPFDMLLGVSRAGTVTKMLGIATGLVLLFYCLRTLHVRRPSTSLIVLLGLLIWAALTMVWSLNPATAAEPLQTLVGLAVLYAALALTPVTSGDLKIILVAIVAGSLAVAIYGIASFHSTFPLAPAADSGDRLVLALGTHSIDPNEYADALIFPLAVIATLAFRSRMLVSKLLGFAGAGIIVTAIALSASREGLIALAVLFAYFLWRSRHRMQLLILGAIAAFALAPFAAGLATRFTRAIITGGAGRTSIWAVGLEAVKHYGLIGAGIGTFPAAYDRFYLAVPQTYLYGWSAPPHNVPLRYLVELGIPGLALVAGFVALHFRMLRFIGRDHPLYDFRVAIEGGLIGLCVTSLFIDSFHSKWVWLVFATAAQLAYLASTHRRRAGPAPAIEP